MYTTYDAMQDLDPKGLAHILTMAYLCGKTGREDPEFLSSHERYADVIQQFIDSLKVPYEDGLWEITIKAPVMPGDDLWWICDEPPYIRCAEHMVKAICLYEGGKIGIIDKDGGTDQLHTRWACVTKEEAKELFLQMVRNKEIDPELHFEGITELSENEMMDKLDEIDALVEYILGDEKTDERMEEK